MAKNAKSLKVAKALLLASIDGEGRVNQQKIQEILKELKNLPRSKTLPVLKNLFSLVRQKIASYEGQVEIASTNLEDISNILSKNLTDTFNYKIDLLASTNNSLLSGFRLRIGDNVYEDSLHQRINRLQKALT
jgi:F-type H+-transporting ATPase subunit delta